LETAIWTPTPVYERLALELKMPKEARERLRDLIIKKQNITV
jgi:hypothetical protein